MSKNISLPCVHQNFVENLLYLPVSEKNIPRTPRPEKLTKNRRFVQYNTLSRSMLELVEFSIFDTVNRTILGAYAEYRAAQNDDLPRIFASQVLHLKIVMVGLEVFGHKASVAFVGFRLTAKKARMI